MMSRFLFHVVWQLRLLSLTAMKIYYKLASAEHIEVDVNISYLPSYTTVE